MFIAVSSETRSYGRPVELYGGPPGSRSRHLGIKSPFSSFSLVTDVHRFTPWPAPTVSPLTVRRDDWPGVVATL
jgi:hypothetical protein